MAFVVRAGRGMPTISRAAPWSCRLFSTANSMAQSKPLDAEQRRFLEQNGYLVLRGFLSKDNCARLEGRLREMIDQFDPKTSTSIFQAIRGKQNLEDEYFLTSGDKIRYFWEKDAFDDAGNLVFPKQDAINKVGHALHTLDSTFKDYVFEALSPTVFSVGMKKPQALQSMYICKSQRTGGEVNPHQDSTYLYTNPMSCHGFWLSIHHATLENGCMWAVPGSHRTPLKDRFVRVKGGQPKLLDVIPTGDHPADLSTEGGVPLETFPGDLVILHGQLVHWSYANKSGNPRHAFVVHCVDGACEYPAENWLQYEGGKPFPQLEKRA